MAIGPPGDAVRHQPVAELPPIWQAGGRPEGQGVSPRQRVEADHPVEAVTATATGVGYMRDTGVAYRQHLLQQASSRASVQQSGSACRTFFCANY